jgi:hypothetical protein
MDFKNGIPRVVLDISFKLLHICMGNVRLCYCMK